MEPIINMIKKDKNINSTFRDGLHNYSVTENEVGILTKHCTACGESNRFISMNCKRCKTLFK